MGLTVSTQHWNEDGEQHTERTVTTDNGTEYVFSVDLDEGTNEYEGDNELPAEVRDHVESEYGPVEGGTADSETSTDGADEESA